MRCVGVIAERRPVVLAIAGTMLLALSAPAFAQDKPAEDLDPFYDLDWGIGLRGAYSSSSTTGGSFEAVIAPEVSFTRNGESDQTTVSADGTFAVDTAATVHVDQLHTGATSTLQFDQYTTLDGSLDLSLDQLRTDDSSLPANTLIAPLEFTGTAEGSATRNLGHFDVTGRLKGERFVEGPTTLDTMAIVDNSDQSYWLGDVGLRFGYELTPLLSVFVDGDIAYTKYDAASPTLLKFLDDKTTTLRGGVSYTQNTTLTAEASVGRAWIDYFDPTIADQAGWVFDGKLGFNPDETLSLESSLETGIGPSDSTFGDTDVEYTLSGNARYQVNPWLTLRASGSFDRTVTLGTAAVDWGYSIGSGVDFASSKHVVWSADYLFTHDNPATGPDDNTHTVTLGVKIKH